MTQYIDKDLLLKFIKERRNGLFALMNRVPYASNYCVWLSNVELLNEIEKVINTFEAKEAVLLTSEEIKKICTIYDNLNQERKCATVLYNSDETFFNHVLMEYKAIASPKQ